MNEEQNPYESSRTQPERRSFTPLLVAAVLVIAILFGVLGIYALKMRTAAMRATQEAERARAIAEQVRMEAEAILRQNADAE